MKVGVVDYGMSNLGSVRRALAELGCDPFVAAAPAELGGADRIVLPGVGSFGDGMKNLAARGWVSAIRDEVAAGKPLLGICLGMQMLMDESEEFGATPGLGLIPGRVVKIPAMTTMGAQHKIPHIGWNELVLPAQRDSWQSSILTKVEPGEAVYFVHSYMAEPATPGHRLADCHYGGIPISAMVKRDNVMGCQFHPEKSGAVGLKILRGFLSP